MQDFTRRKMKLTATTIPVPVRKSKPRDGADGPSLISEGLIYHADTEHHHEHETSLTRHSATAHQGVPLQTQELVKWLKRPAAIDQKDTNKFVPDLPADAELKKIQQAAMELKISHLFEGNKRSVSETAAQIPKSLLSPFTQYFLRDHEIRAEEQVARRALEMVKFDLNASRDKKYSLDEKRILINDYVKWIVRQIHISGAVREQTSRRAARDRRLCEQANENRMEAFRKQKDMMGHRNKLREVFRARKKWRIFLHAFEGIMGKTWYDIDDFCGFYEMTTAVLELCTSLQDAEREQLSIVQREAEIRPEEWGLEKASLEERLLNAMAKRDDLANEMIELQNLNRTHKNTHESDKAEWDRLVEGVDELSYSVCSLSGKLKTSYPNDNLQRMEAFERFLIVTGRVEERLILVLGPKLDYDEIFQDASHDYELLPAMPDPRCNIDKLPGCE